MRRILIDESEDDAFENMHGENTKFIINTNEDDIVKTENEANESYD